MYRDSVTALLLWFLFASQSIAGDGSIVNPFPVQGNFTGGMLGRVGNALLVQSQYDSDSRIVVDKNYWFVASGRCPPTYRMVSPPFAPGIVRGHRPIALAGISIEVALVWRR